MARGKTRDPSYGSEVPAVGQWVADIEERSGRLARSSEIDAMTLATALARPVRQKEFRKLGIHQQHMAELAKLGLLERVSRGCYRIAGSEPPIWGFLAAATMRWPSAVFCGPTAASYHGLSEDGGGPIWLAVPRGKGRPQGTVSGRTICVREWLDERLIDGVSEYLVDGTKIKVISPALAVAELRELGKRVHPRSSTSATMAYVETKSSLSELEEAFEKVVPFRPMPASDAV